MIYREHEDTMAAGDLYLPHFSITFGGVFWGVEQWSMGLRMTPGVYDTPQLRDDFCVAKIADVAADVKNWWTAQNSGTSEHGTLDWVKMNAIGADGKYENPSTTHSVRVLPAGTAGTFPYRAAGALPPQIALVLSLRTGNRGPREAWGHIYMPVTNCNLASGGPLLHPDAVNNIASEFKDLINDLNNWPGIDPIDGPKVCVASKYSKYTPKGKPEREYQAALTDVTDVWVGNKYDTHRSRSKSIQQTFTKYALD